MYLATLIFLYALITETILILGYSYVTRRAYQWYINFTKDKRVAKQQKLKRDLLVLKNELSQTSSQDEFAKWAKMRRKLDKGMADLEKLTSDINFNKASFELRAKSVLWFLVHGTRTIIVMWFARQATFYLPKGWFGPAEWFLWMPLAPKGAVSVAIWMSACRQVIKQSVSMFNDFILHKIKADPVEN
ncbi:get1_copc7 ame: full protein get1 ame: fullguided entry of tail-anchored proteins 1 [Lichtheimia corymbifera JMRC:FSU:9682]|uniref:Get1_copc7 ame: full protein get1 ame: fullguided entry of tail-anchored proteins 1 n=1 Tax=Lichtheimia corymbifera JMRC:FSU:9682 TaxID=1263082 RepID=A0A068RFR2_9FUNG|nr:get1_copc7 ame: full protein get1 ame: fullguided entry of tail-anchored proteins 1 [Lichtheimia corymbifera JMRC:FSU:9682]